MKCPTCDPHVSIEDWDDDKPYPCDKCGAGIPFLIDLSSKKEVTDKCLQVGDE